MIDSLDDLLEAYLNVILHMKHVQHVEVQMFNSQNNLMRVAEAKWSGGSNDRKPLVYSESWILEYPAKYAAKINRRIQIRPVWSIALMDSGINMGCLNIQLDKLHLIKKNQLDQFYLIGMQLAANIRNMRLKTEIEETKEQLSIQISNVSEIQQQATSLSKELYAISAISAKINQSMDFDKTLYRCLATIRKVFKASGILIYTKSDPLQKVELTAVECEDESVRAALNKKYLKRIEKDHLKWVLQSGKPVVKDRLAEVRPSTKVRLIAPFTSLVGVPLSSRQTTIGAMLLLYRVTGQVNHSGLRLLSGVANIMGMAIENMALYRQSVQKKEETDFLFRSIVKFNKTLNLKTTLTSVAEKGVEYCGVQSRVYLFPQIKTRVICSQYKKQKHGQGYTLHSSQLKRIEPTALHRVYLQVVSLVGEKSLLIRSLNHCRKISRVAKADFRELNIFSLMVVPLKIGSKKLGILLLVRGKEANAFSQQELRFAEALAGSASLVIENARAYSASQDMSEFLEKKISKKTNQIRQIQDRQAIRAENRKDIIFRVNRHNQFIFVNKAMEELSGLQRETLCHKDFRAVGVVAEQERAHIKELFRKVLTKDITMAKEIEYHHINHNGADHVISLTVYPEYDQNGRVVGVEGVGRDITEEKRLEAELKKAKELALLGEFSGAMAHQMRNPLGNILMSTKRLEKALGLHDGQWCSDMPSNDDDSATPNNHNPISDIFKNLSQGVYNLNQVVTELLEYTKTLKLSRSLQRMDIILKEIVTTFSSLLEQYQIKVRLYFDDNLPAIFVDAVLIGQAFQNVVYNAIQAMPQGGDLTVISGISELNPEEVLLSVRDTGHGIDPAEIDRVFRPFYTTKSMGTGLGLSVAHRIVEAHGGTIQVCRNPCLHLPRGLGPKKGGGRRKTECGTTVHILLPLRTRPENPLGE